MKKKEKKIKAAVKKNESVKIIQTFLISAIVCLCVSAFACGFFSVRTNTVRLSAGDEPAQLAATQRDEVISLKTPEKELGFSTASAKRFANILYLLPQPVSGIALIIEYAGELFVNNY